MLTFFRTLGFLILCTGHLFSQSFPWQQPLMMAWSPDGTTFNTPALYQDSAGVPSMIRWKNDTLICAFQWFREPVNSTTWDRVAVKFSYDDGASWTQPTPIVINGIPSSYQRPFDPTLTTFNGDSIRIYFSSSDGIPSMGLDSTVNTYSAWSVDGINFNFETGPRVDEISNRVIDPSVIHFKNLWHYIAPAGSPQQGAYHYVGPDGINFSSTPVITSDAMHNWTGNYMINDSNELRFYGAGQSGIWYNSSPNGGQWNGYVNTNIHGGDPAVLKVSAINYLMVFVGPPGSTGLEEESNFQIMIEVYPNPSSGIFTFHQAWNETNTMLTITDMVGRIIESVCIDTDLMVLNLSGQSSGIYQYNLTRNGEIICRGTLVKN